jgi:hypothetical protein
MVKGRFFVRRWKGETAKVYKELVIGIIIIIVIASLDAVTQKYTRNSTDEIIGKLHTLKEQIESSASKEDKKNTIDEAYSKWEEFHDISAIFIEHNELEKVEIDMVACRNFIEQDIFDMASNELEKVIFGLEHIEDKYAFSLINVF